MSARVQEVMDIICLNTCDKGKYGVDHQAIHDEIVRWHNANLAPIAEPKPEEPTYRGAVVKDRRGSEWVRVHPDGKAWVNGYQRWAAWNDIDAVEAIR